MTQWTDQEIRILSKLYPDSTYKDLKQAFPDRKLDAIRKKAQLLGLKRRVSLITKFWEKVNISHNCWEWQGHRKEDGYGGIKFHKKTYLTHRVSWEIHYGTIPEGVCVLHKCDNPPCVNPEHLFLGTKDVNNKDRKTKGRNANTDGENNPNAKLSNQDAEQIRKRYIDGDKVTQLAIDYNVGVTTIYDIIRYRKYKK